MKKLIKRVFSKAPFERFHLGLCMALLLCGTPSLAQGLLADQAQLLVGATLEMQTEEENKEYRVLRNAVKKVNNRWRAEETKPVGQVIRSTYLLNPILSFADAKFALQKEIAEQAEKYLLLHSCVGMDCGSSNGLANHYLNIMQLYGLDNYQFYIALERLDASEPPSYFVFYLVQRGNKRIYLQYDTVVSQPDITDI